MTQPMIPKGAFSALLRPDPAEASEPLQSAPCVNAPVDCGPRAAAHGEAGTLHEPTVRACVEIVERLSRDAVPPPDQYAEAFDAGIRSVCADIQTELAALLPKPDPAKELVEAFASDTRDEGGSEIVRTPNTEWQFAHYTRWLIDTGRLTP